MRWPYYKHLFFDCDSTLTAVEGIDLLAESDEKSRRVNQLTQAAMEGALDLEEVYARRLQILKPTRLQVQTLRYTYKQHIVKDAAAVIALLQELGHHVYIISGGLEEPVVEFGLFLGVPREHIRAVGLEYNQLAGAWWEKTRDLRYQEKYLTFDKGALTVSDGKAQIARELMGRQSGRSLLVGDGVSDLLAGRAVDLFVGYGGVVERPRVREEAPIFIHSESLAPLLPLATGPAILRQRLQQDKNHPHGDVIKRALDLVDDDAIIFNDSQLKTNFQEAFHVPY